LILTGLLAATLAGCGGSSGSEGGGSLGVDLVGGGSITFPPGAVPDGTQVSAKTTHNPVLPDWATAVGSAILIETDGVLSELATVRLPVPSGVDPNTLMIVRVEASGALTVLSTRIEGGMLVAETPGFSTFQATTLEALLAQGLTIDILGPDIIPARSEAVYTESQFFSKLYLSHDWLLFGPEFPPGGQVPVSTSSTDTAIYAEMQAPGRMTVTVTVTEASTGARVFVSKAVSVQDLSSPDEGIVLSAIPPDPVVLGQAADPIQVRALNALSPLNWIWSNAGGDGQCSGCGTVITIPGAIYDAPGKEIVQISVSDQLGNLATTQVEVVIRPNQIRLVSFVPDDAREPFPFLANSLQITSRAEVTGGLPGYNFNWVLAPTGEEKWNFGLGPKTFSFVVSEPGGYVVNLTVTDTSDPAQPLELFGSVMVMENATPLVATMGVVGPEVAKTPTIVRVNAIGGVLIVHGKKRGYVIDIDYGDNTSEQVTEGAFSSLLGVDRNFAHTWQEPGTYLVTVTVTDATGALDIATLEVVVEAPPVEPPTTGPFTLVWYWNTDGVNAYDGFENAQVSLSGTATAPVFSWTGLDAQVVSVRHNSGTFTYGIVTDQADEGGNAIPIAPPVTYGDYAKPGTTVLGVVPVPALTLVPGERYTVTVVKINSSQVANLEFDVNR
jgi:hypothetical protein